MRKRADWMKPVDDLILEFIDENGAGTPQRIAAGLDKNNDYIGVRCRKLTNHGLLERPARGLYQLNSDGEGYLAGDVDASELE